MFIFGTICFVLFTTARNTTFFRGYASVSTRILHYIYNSYGVNHLCMLGKHILGLRFILSGRLMSSWLILFCRILNNLRQDFQNLAEMCLLVLHLEIRCHCFYYLLQALKQVWIFFMILHSLVRIVWLITWYSLSSFLVHPTQGQN